MLAHRVAFVIALALTGATVLLRGGKAEAIGYGLLCADFLATPLMQDRSSWYHAQAAVFCLDVAYAAALIAVSLRTTKHWAIVQASLQTTYVFIYLPFWLFPHELYRAFYMAGSALGYALEVTLIFGCILNGRAKSAARSGEPGQPVTTKAPPAGADGAA